MTIRQYKILRSLYRKNKISTEVMPNTSDLNKIHQENISVIARNPKEENIIDVELRRMDKIGLYTIGRQGKMNTNYGLVKTINPGITSEGILQVQDFYKDYIWMILKNAIFPILISAITSLLIKQL